MTRWTALAVALAVAVPSVMALVVSHLIRGERAQLQTAFASERMRKVEEAAHIVSDDLADASRDLLVAGELFFSEGEGRNRGLQALLKVVQQYDAVQVFDAQGTRLAALADGDAEPAVTRGDFDGIMAHSARTAIGREPGVLDVTPPLQAGADRWYRVFATAVRHNAEGRSPGAVAMMVDTEPLFRKLRLIPSADARLLFLGRHGLSTPVTDARLRELVDDLGTHRPRVPEFASVVDAMRAGESGVRLVPPAEASALGFEPREVLVAYAPVRAGDGGAWSIATVNSMASVRAHESAAVLRVAAGALAVFILLSALMIYALVMSRRAAHTHERLRHAEQLAHLHELTQKILDTIPTGVLALSEELTITSANRAVRDRIPAGAFGAPLAAAFPQAPAAVVDRVTALVTAAAQSGRPRSLHGERLALFGAEGQYSVHAVPLETNFPQARALLVLEDVSEVRSLASQLLRAEKLATVGVLAAGIAHEVGTPLGVVRGRAEYMLSKLGRDSAHAPGIQVIVEQIDMVTRTIRQLLDFSRIRPAAVQRVAVGPLVKGVVELLRFEAERRKVQLQVDIPEDTPAVSADPDQLQQVLVNLVMNAFDACSQKGTVTIVARGEDAGPDASWQQLRLEVVDDGCGIPEEHRAQVFDPFFTTKKRGQGTGLGLTLAAQIVRNHGGEVEVDSTPGVGTRMMILWPVAKPAEERHGISV